MARMQPVEAYTPVPTTLLILFHPGRQQNNFRIVSDPDDLTPTEIREILEAALTVANQAIADEMSASIPDDPEQEDQANIDALYEHSANEVTPNVDDSSDVSELQYEPVDDAIPIVDEDKDTAIAAITPRIHRTNARDKTPAKSGHTRKNKQ